MKTATEIMEYFHRSFSGYVMCRMHRTKTMCERFVVRMVHDIFIQVPFLKLFPLQLKTLFLTGDSIHVIIYEVFIYYLL